MNILTVGFGYGVKVGLGGRGGNGDGAPSAVVDPEYRIFCIARWMIMPNGAIAQVLFPLTVSVRVN